MKTPLLSLCFLISSALCSVSAAQTKQDTIQITTEHYYPFSISDKDGVVYGASADKIHELFKRSKLTYQMNMLSWNRAFELARNNANTCVFSTSRTKERESSFHWIGPVMTGNWAMFGSPDKLNKVTNLKDIKQSTIGTEEGQVSLAYLSDKGFKIVTSTESITTFKNVALGRIDYATAADTHGKKIIAENNLKDKVVWLFNYSSSDYYLACNPKMQVGTIALLNKNLAKMKADGSFKRIENKY